jgi:hypothetical protein
MKILVLNMGVSARKIQLMKNSVAPPLPYSCTLPITAPVTMLLLLLLLLLPMPLPLAG